MKKKFLIFVLTLLVCLSGLALIGCSDDPPSTDYNANLQTVASEDIDTEHFVPEEDTTYYTSSELYLCI